MNTIALTETEATQEQLKFLASAGISSFKTVVLEELGLFKITDLVTGKISYRTMDAVCSTNWVERIECLEHHLKLYWGNYICYRPIDITNGASTGTFENISSERIVFGKYLEITDSRGHVIYFSLDLTQSTQWFPKPLDQIVIERVMLT